MKNSQIAIIVAIAVLIGYAIVELGNKSTLGAFEDAFNNKDSKTTVVANINREKDPEFDARNGTLTFEATDKIYNKPEPTLFDRADEIRMTGHTTDSAFIAEDILMKCPSKYNEENGIDSVNVYY
jgi:cytochrome c-type biogenesis protein CcmE